MAPKKAATQRYKNTAFLTALGSQCRKLRIQKGYSIDRLAKEGEQLSPGAIHRLEMGTADVQISLLYRYAQVLGITLNQIFKFEENFTDSPESIIPFEEGKKQPPQSVPFYSLKVAAGLLDKTSAGIEPEGWVVVPKKGLSKDYFAARVDGKSMEPTIPHGSLCLFKKYSGGTRQGKILLIQARALIDPETGGRFVIKRYERKTSVSQSEDRGHVVVHLVSDNPEFAPIVLKNTNEEDISTPAVFVEIIKG